MLSGLGYTLLIAVFSVLLGIILGALLAVCKVIPQKNFIANSKDVDEFYVFPKVTENRE